MPTLRQAPERHTKPSPSSLGKPVTEHGESARRGRARRLVLEHVPVFGQKSALYAEDIACNPVRWPAVAREPSVRYDEVPLGHDQMGVVAKSRRKRLDQVEKAFAPR